MLKLVKNEYTKIFYKKTTYIVFILCLVLGLGISALIQYSDTYYDYDYSTSIPEEKTWYSDDSDYIYDRIEYKLLSLYEDMGYEYYSDIPTWVSDAAYDYVYRHYAYILLSESDNLSDDEINLGLYLSNTDIEYEKEICEEMEAAITSLDYKTYYNLCIEYYERQTARGYVCNSATYKYASGIIEYDIDPTEDESILSLLSSYIDAEIDYDYYIADEKSGERYADDVAEEICKKYFTYKYIIENDVENYMLFDSDFNDVYSENKLMTVLASDTTIASLAGIFAIIIAAGIFANEYSSGTIKFLLINPVKRAKIFWSKYITCISLFAGALAVFYIVYFLFALIICSTNGIDGVFLSYADGAVKEQSIILYSLKQYGLAAVSMITSITLAFAISAFLRSTALAIAISLVIEFAGSTMSLFLYAYNHDWGRYLLFSNTDLASFSNGLGLFPGQTLTFALVTIAIYMVVFLLTAYDGFTKKEI